MMPKEQKAQEPVDSRDVYDIARDWLVSAGGIAGAVGGGVLGRGVARKLLRKEKYKFVPGKFEYPEPTDFTKKKIADREEALANYPALKKAQEEAHRNLTNHLRKNGLSAAHTPEYEELKRRYDTDSLLLQEAEAKIRSEPYYDSVKLERERFNKRENARKQNEVLEMSSNRAADLRAVGRVGALAGAGFGTAAGVDWARREGARRKK